MTTADHTLDTMVTEFPRFQTRLTELYYNSESFLEVCEDYVICLEAIKKMQAKKSLSKNEELEDLRNIINELETELLSKI